MVYSPALTPDNLYRPASSLKRDMVRFPEVTVITAPRTGLPLASVTTPPIPASEDAEPALRESAAVCCLSLFSRPAAMAATSKTQTTPKNRIDFFIAIPPERQSSLMSLFTHGVKETDPIPKK
jgi:hypothetical protein